MFIIITQYLFEWCIYARVYPVEFKASNHFQFLLILLASVFIAAAGYIINDYFDQNIDQINKPDKMVVNTIIMNSANWKIEPLSGGGSTPTSGLANPRILR